MLQTGRSHIRFPMMSLEFFIDVILLAIHSPGIDSASNRNVYQEYFLGEGGGKGVQHIGPTTFHVPIFLKAESLNLLEPSGPVQASSGIVYLLPLLTEPEQESITSC